MKKCPDIRTLVVSAETKDGFYPTPPALSERLLSGIDWEKIENVLEPQAGKGNIVRAVMEKYVALRGMSSAGSGCVSCPNGFTGLTKRRHTIARYGITASSILSRLRSIGN